MRAFLFLEASPGFEPGNKGFADLCLTAWLWRHGSYTIVYAADVKLMPNKNGAGYEARTRYLHLGKVALYQMSYARMVPRAGIEPATRGFSVHCSTN